VVHKKRAAILVSISLPNIDQFSKLFYCCTAWTICDKNVIKDFTALKTRRYTTLSNIHFQKNAPTEAEQRQTKRTLNCDHGR